MPAAGRDKVTHQGGALQRGSLPSRKRGPVQVIDLERTRTSKTSQREHLEQVSQHIATEPCKASIGGLTAVKSELIYCSPTVVSYLYLVVTIAPFFTVRVKVRVSSHSRAATRYLP